MGDIAERVAKAKKEVESLKQQVLKAREDKTKGYSGIAKMATDKAPLGPTLKQRRILKGHFGKIYAMQWADQGDESKKNTLVSASQDGKLIVWNALPSHPNKLQAIPLRSSWVMTCAFEQSRGNLVACGGLDNLCSIYQLNQPQVMRSHRELAAHDGYLSCCRFVGESSILTSSGDSTCMLWDVELGTQKTTFADHEGDVMSLSILPSVDPNMFISGSCDSLAKVWDIRTDKCVMTLRGHESDINSVSMFPDCKAFGTGSDDSTCKLFDIRACAEVAEFKNEMVLCGITSVTFSKTGRLLFAGYDDYNCLGWDVLGSTEKQAYQLHPGHENRVSCLGVNATGDALCTGSWDTMLKVWA